MAIQQAQQPTVLNALGYRYSSAANPVGGVTIGTNVDGVDFSGTLWQNGAQVKNVIDYDLYDTVRLPVGTYGPGRYTLFQNPVGASRTTGITTAAAFVGTSYDTNIEDQNALPKGYDMVIHNIQVQVMTPAALDTTALGVGTTINPTRLTDGSSDNQTSAIIQSSSLLFKVENREYERGSLQNFPCEFGCQGFTSQGGGTNAAPTFMGIMNNGFGNHRPMSYWRYLREQQRFNVFIDNPNTITIVAGTAIRVHLVGWLFVPVG